MDGEDSRASLKNDEFDNARVCGQWQRLREIFSAVKLVGCNITKGVRQPRNEIFLEDETIKIIRGMCRKLRRDIQDRSNDTNNESDTELIVDSLNEIFEAVPEMLAQHDEHESGARVVNIY